MDSLQEILRQIDCDFKKAGMKYGSIKRIEWSGRMTKAKGKCIRQENAFVIRLSESIRQYPELIKNVLAHELIHTIPGCFNHGAKFQYYASRLNRFGYQVSTYFDQEGAQNKYGYSEPKSKITLECTKCHKQFGYSRECNATRHPEKMIHKHCGGALKRIQG